MFSKYDAFIFPTLSENYGHVIVESLIVGTPVIISNNTPWTDVNDFGCGGAFSLDDSMSFSLMIQKIIDADQELMSEFILRTRRYIDTKLKLADLESRYNSVLNAVVEHKSNEQ